LDPKSIAVLAESLFPSKGAELINTWRLRQFEYSWLRNSMGRYADFWTVTSEALVFAARLAKLDLSKEKPDQLMNGFLDMKAYPDVQPAIQALSRRGHPLWISFQPDGSHDGSEYQKRGARRPIRAIAQHRPSPSL
jgi:2-haloacid dehalogenase